MREVLAGVAIAAFGVTPVLLVQEPSTRHCRTVEERPASPSVGIVIGGTGFAVRTEAESRMRSVEQCRSETSGGSGSVTIEERERIRAPN